MANEWTKPEHVEAYLARAREIPHRGVGEATLLSELVSAPGRVLDLGCGDGHLLSLVLASFPEATGIGLDFSPTMLAHAKERFAGNGRVRLVEHNLDARLPELGSFDAVVSSFAIHHCEDDRKRSLYAEIFEMLEPGGCFCNLEHVASPSEMLHHRFLAELELRPEEEDPSNKLLDVHTQLEWLRELGFEHVDCVWKWRELALLVGRKASGVTQSSECHDEPSVRH